MALRVKIDVGRMGRDWDWRLAAASNTDIARVRSEEKEEEFIQTTNSAALKIQVTFDD